MEEKRPRRKLIMRIMTVFIVIMLFLTFFSNTILNYSLPEVATATVSSGTVTNRVSVEGEVEMNSDYEVTVSGQRVIREVKFESGDKVKEGDVLFVFEDGENTELSEAKDQLESLEINYAKSLLKMAPDYEDDNEAITEAKADLQKAIDEQTEAKKKNKELDALKKTAAKAKAKVEKQQEKVNKLKEKVDGYSEKGDYSTATAQVETDRAAVKSEEASLASLKKELSRLTEDYNDTKDAYSKNVAAYKAYLLKLDEYKKKMADFDAGRIDKEPEAPDPVSEPELPSEKEYKRNVEDKQIEIAASEERLAAAKEQLKKSEKAVKTLSPSVDVNADYKVENKTLELYQAELAKADKAVEDYGTVTENEAATENVKTKRKALETAIEALDDKKKQDALTAESEAYDKKSSEKEIEKQKEKIKKLEEQDDINQVKSKHDGIITEISCKAGDTVAAETPIAKVQIEGSGYIVKTTVTKQQANLIKVGNTATVENVWDRELTAEVKSIKPNPENAGQSMNVVFTIKGDATPSENIQMTVGEKSGRYDTIVPSNAVKTDSEGKFVLVVTVKGTPLGNRYNVKKVRVDVEATDGKSTAVSGEIFEWENVVTNASKSLDDGQQVRLTSGN